MNSLNMKMLSGFNPGTTATTRSWPGRLDDFEAPTRRQWLNCVNRARTLRITACASISSGGGGSGGVESQRENESSFLSRSQTYALLKQKMEVAAKSEDYKEAARLRDSLRLFEEEEPILRLRRLIKEAVANERFEDAARYRDELKDIAPHSLYTTTLVLMMEGEAQDVADFQLDFTDEDFAEINAIMKLAATSDFEEISELYKSSEDVNYADNAMDSGSVDKKMLNDVECASLLAEDFSTREELLDRVRNLALKEGYVTTIKKSKPGCYVIIGCDRGGKYRGTSVPLNEGKRMSGSRLVNCPFQMLGKKKAGKPWKVEIRNLSHNHEPSSDMSGHPFCRRFSKEEVLSIKQMTRAGIAPRQILISLRQSNSNCKAIARTVYNAKAAIKKEVLAGRTMIQALFDELGRGDFTFDVKRDGNGHLTHFFFAHPSSIALTKSYPYVFVMDCTYKTNKYKMPLLDLWALERFKAILGPNQQPSVIVSDRELALMNAIEVVFPGTANILCVWHIEKNILSKCKSQFERGEDWETLLLAWTNLVESPDESCFTTTFRDCIG